MREPYEPNNQEPESGSLKKLLELLEELLKQPLPEFHHSFRKEVSLEQFSNQLFEVIHDEFNGLIAMEQSYHIKIKLITGEQFQIVVSK